MEYNYYSIKKLNEKNFQLMNNLRKLNNNIFVKNMLNSSKTDYNNNHNNQVIIHTEINNYTPLKEYIINLNNIRNSNNDKYQRHISPENFVKSQQKWNRIKNNYIKIQKEINNKSFSKVNNPSNKELSTIDVKYIKPYKKKAVLFNPNKSKDKCNNIYLDITNYSETINSNCVTDRTFEKSKLSFLKDEENSEILNNNNNKYNKYNYNIKEVRMPQNKQIKYLNTSFHKNKNYNTINNYNNNNSFNNNQKCRKIPLSKAHIINKDFILNKIQKNRTLNSNDSKDSKNNKYHKRFAQVLILLIEKFLKIYLLKNKYIFIKNLQKYKKINIGRNKMKNIYNNNICLTERDTENKSDHIYSLFNNTRYKTKNDNILLYKLKNENVKYSPDRLKYVELFRNKSELLKKKEIIKRRKQSNSKKKTNENNKKIIFNNIQNNYINIIKKNRSFDNKTRIEKNNSFYNKAKPMLIIKKIKTKDNRINIDIKYLEQIYLGKKKSFKRLKISNTNSINIIMKKNNYFKFDKIYYKIENQNDYLLKKGKKLSCIKEEE